MNPSSQLTTGGDYGNPTKRDSDTQPLSTKDSISQFYINEHPWILEIQRLGRDVEPLESGYVDLSLVESPPGKEIQQPGHGVSQAVPNKEVLLQDLFKHRTLRDGSHGKPSRVLIRGHAGMGKTTLCKKIIHAFVRNELWQSEFDSVIFIDLRVAKHFWSASKFFEECFRVSFWPKDWYIELMKAADDPGDTRTLVVFDGLEELSQDQWESWDTFLHRKNVIITCRPHVLSKWKRLQFDLDVQVIGFHDDEVSSYLNKMVPDAPDVLKPQFMDFIAQHPVIKDMLRIPIISDAVCSLWVDCVGRRKRVTMATLYQEIEIRLWQKDLIRLHGMTISHSSSYIYPRKLYEIFSREVGFLRSIAFFGVYNNITEFPESIRRKFQSLELQVLEHVFDIISFLRSTAYRFNASVRDYSFLHPTFQQYFAAHYFLDCWKFGKDIEALDLNYNQINSQPTECFRKERQNERYDLMWQFVMGALNCEDRDQLEKALEQSYEERWFF